MGVALLQQAIALAVHALRGGGARLVEVAARVEAEELLARLLGHHRKQLADRVVAVLGAAARQVQRFDQLAVGGVAVAGVDAHPAGDGAHPVGLTGAHAS